MTNLLNYKFSILSKFNGECNEHISPESNKKKKQQIFFVSIRQTKKCLYAIKKLHPKKSS